MYVTVPIERYDDWPGRIPYWTVSRCLRERAIDYVARGCAYLMIGNAAYARGCFLKAEKKFKMAKQYELPVSLRMPLIFGLNDFILWKDEI